MQDIATRVTLHDGHQIRVRLCGGRQIRVRRLYDGHPIRVRVRKVYDGCQIRVSSMVFWMTVVHSRRLGSGGCMTGMRDVPDLSNMGLGTQYCHAMR